MIHKNSTWDLVEKSQDKNINGVKWVYRVKFNSDGSINKYKARLVVKGNAQQSKALPCGVFELLHTKLGLI